MWSTPRRASNEGAVGEGAARAVPVGVAAAAAGVFYDGVAARGAGDRVGVNAKKTQDSSGAILA